MRKRGKGHARRWLWGTDNERKGKKGIKEEKSVLLFPLRGGGRKKGGTHSLLALPGGQRRERLKKERRAEKGERRKGGNVSVHLLPGKEKKKKRGKGHGS